MRLSVCLSASMSLELLDRSARNSVCGSPWPWLGPPPAALRYVMYFRLYEWRHVWPQWARRGKVEADPLGDCRVRSGDSGAESDVYECLVLILYCFASVSPRHTN